MFGEGTDAVKKSLEGIFDDTVPDGKVKINENKHVFLLEACKRISMCTMLWWWGGDAKTEYTQCEKLTDVIRLLKNYVIGYREVEKSFSV